MGVPLHSRLFAQWLHHVFPADCVYPHITEKAEVFTTKHWEGKKSVVGAGDLSIPQHYEDSSSHVDDVDSWVPQWTNEEVLPLQEPKKIQNISGTSMLRI